MCQEHVSLLGKAQGSRVPSVLPGACLMSAEHASLPVSFLCYLGFRCMAQEGPLYLCWGSGGRANLGAGILAKLGKSSRESLCLPSRCMYDISLFTFARLLCRRASVQNASVQIYQK